MSKHNLRKIPSGLIEKLSAFDQDDLVVACAKLLRAEDIPRYAHLGVTLEDGKLTTQPPRVPAPPAGRYSRANVEGLEKVRKDLPMVTKEFSMESPNWGDPSRGYHQVTHSRDVYVRDFYPPKEVTMSVTLLEERSSAFFVKFAVDQVLNRRTEHFEQELLYNLNILQENVGAVDVFPSAATLAEYAATVRVDWQILPPGSADEVVRGLLTRSRSITPEQEKVIRERVSLMDRLKPQAYVAGTDGFLRYFGAQFGDDFVAFENVRYGNAIYLMYESWRELSQRSRVDLLGGDRDVFDRIVHRPGWEEKLEAAVRKYRV